MQHDAIVIGGSFAGLSAATYIARARKRVTVIDAGAPRNRFAAHSHGFLSQDGSEPRAILSTARVQLASYAEASLVAAKVIEAHAIADGFAVTLADGTIMEATKLVLAFGVTDVLPEVPGLTERWGRTVLHCPYCHGYEFSGRPLGVLHTASHSAHQAMLISEWGPTTFFLNGNALPDEATREALAQRNVRIETRAVVGLAGDEDAPTEVMFENGGVASVDALFITAPWKLSSDLAERLGCAIDDGPMGPVIWTDDLKMTSVPGVYAAGDIARAPHTVTWAASDGVTAGLSVHRALAFG
jgi:thioredoxin reductase